MVSRVRALVRWVLAPSLLYLACFAVVTFPAITRFSTHFLADAGDGFVNVWNIWWIDHAVSHLRQSFWYTSYLHYPYGTSLVAHTLNPFNGLVGIALLRALTLVQTHNVIVVGSFVAGGWATFLLCAALTGTYTASLVGGFVFSFSNFHFAHAQGHLNLVSLEWIPVFVLASYRLLLRPRVDFAVGAAVALFLVLLCDYYYFLYCVLTLFVMAAWRVVRIRSAPVPPRVADARPLAVFTLAALLLCVPIIGQLLRLSHGHGLVGSHDPLDYSLDLLAPLVPGGHWRFAWLTEAYWSRLPGNIHESSVHVGLSVLALMFLAWRRRVTLPLREPILWFLLGGIFALLALGPALHVAGHQVTQSVMPYAWFARVFPPLKLGGAPVRMIVVTQLCVAVLASASLAVFGRERPVLAAALVVLMAVEYLPKPLPTTSASVRRYVEVVRDLPPGGGVLDLVSGPTGALYAQTVHQKPIAFGYIARTPWSVTQKDRALEAVVRDRRWETLCEHYHLWHVLLPESEAAEADDARVIYREDGVSILDLGCESRDASHVD